jgi:deoxyribonuclease-1-like protein
MRKSFVVFLVGVVGGTIWLLLQNYTVDGLKGLKIGPRDPADAASQATVPISAPVNSSQASIRIASFNIQVFGRSKLDKPAVMQTITHIVRQFDVIAIQEIRSRDDDILPQFVEMLNAGGRHYDFVIGPRLGRSVSKEQYAFVFDQQTIEVDRNQLYTINDPSDALHREPFVGWFRARAAPSDQAFTFSLINIHTDPDEVQEEVNVLDDVFAAVRNDGRQEDDAILLGDLNADDKHLGQLGRMANFFPVISGVATTVTGKKQYDNLIFDRLATTEFTGRAGVLDFLREYNLSADAAKEVSDHLPIWAEFSVFEGGQPGRIAARPGDR